MSTPFTRVTKVSEAHRQLVTRGEAMGVRGRTPAGSTLEHVAGRPGLDRRPRGDEDEDNFNPDGSRKDRRERKPRYKVELLCRTFSGDIGLRPLPNMVFWESPDIEIVGPAGDPDIAAVGQVNTVRVHLWNLGLADCWAAHVDLYWCDPSIGINPGVANPIGSKDVPIAAGQHTVVEFEWVPELVNNGHECLVAQVYDPVSDPVVAPFNPVQDRHVGQRNVSVIQLAAGQALSFDLFTQNLGFIGADTLIEVQKIEGEALDLLASALGREAWAIAGGTDVQLSPPMIIDMPEHPQARELRTGAFRETLQDVPGRSETRRVMGVMQTLVAPRKRLGGRQRDDVADTAAQRHATQVTTGRAVEVAAEFDDKAGGMRLQLLPGQRVQFSLKTALPRSAARGSADVWRVIEHTAGRITGGVTIVVEAK